MTILDQSARADLLARRAGRIDDELDQAAADGWLVYDFRGSNPAFGRLLGRGLPQSTRRAFLFIPRSGEPQLLVHEVDAGNFTRVGPYVVRYGGHEDLRERLHALLRG